MAQVPSTAPDITQQVFGWNPFSVSGRDPAKTQVLPEWASTNHEIGQLTDLYQQQLAELVAAHSLLLNDQESLASMLSPFVGPDGSFIESPDENLLLMKKGLDLRLLEFEEDCRRIQQTERRLQRKIENCTLTYETSLIEAKGYADKCLTEQIKEQQRLIEYQQHELDELRFQRDLYSDETLRLRQLCRFGEFRPGEKLPPKRETPPPTPRTLHREYSSAKPPFAWMRQIRHGNKKLDADRITRPRSRPRPVSSSPPDRPFSAPSKPKPPPKHRPEPKVSTEPGVESSGGGGGLLSMIGGMFGESKSDAGRRGEGDDIIEKHSSFLGPAKSGVIKSRVMQSPRKQSDERRSEEKEREKKRIAKEQEEEIVDLRRISSSSSSEDAPKSLPLKPPTLEARRPSGGGLQIKSRQMSNASSMQSSPRRSASRTVASPRPTTLSGLTAETLDREKASKFF